jgi:hypothetical protein
MLRRTRFPQLLRNERLVEAPKPKRLVVKTKVPAGLAADYGDYIITHQHSETLVKAAPKKGTRVAVKTNVRAGLIAADPSAGGDDGIASNPVISGIDQHNHNETLVKTAPKKEKRLTVRTRLKVGTLQIPGQRTDY